MKKILLMVVLSGIFVLPATAQSSKYAVNYKICKSETGYQVCAPTQEPGLTPMPAERMTIRKATLLRSPGEELRPCYTLNGKADLDRKMNSTQEAQPASNATQNNKRNLNYGNNAQLAPSNGVNTR